LLVPLEISALLEHQAFELVKSSVLLLTDAERKFLALDIDLLSSVEFWYLVID